MHQLRWMISRDQPRCVEIDAACFPLGRRWDAKHFADVLRMRNCIGYVADRGVDHKIDVPDAYVIYELHKKSLVILALAVDPLIQREGLGRLIIDKLKAKLMQGNRRELIVHVHERSTSAQLFFRAMGFMAVEIVRDHYDDGDAYEMRFALPSEVGTRRLARMDN